MIIYFVHDLITWKALVCNKYSLSDPTVALAIGGIPGALENGMPELFSPDGKCQRLLSPISDLDINYNHNVYNYFLSPFAYIDNKIYFCGLNNPQGKQSSINDVTLSGIS